MNVRGEKRNKKRKREQPAAASYASALDAEYRYQYAEDADADADVAVHEIPDKGDEAADKKEQQRAHALENTAHYHGITGYHLRLSHINTYLSPVGKTRKKEVRMRAGNGGCWKKRKGIYPGPV
jgi:hypothetical protein